MMTAAAEMLRQDLSPSDRPSKWDVFVNMMRERRETLVDLEKSKFISDKFYSESKSRSLIQKGSSINKIRNYLIST